MKIPQELFYTNDHEWVRVEGNVAIVGITDYAQSELDELVYVEVETVGDSMDAGDIFGIVEAVKTTSDLFMPVSGKIIAFNEALDDSKGDNPTLINEDPYGEGWIVKIEMSDQEELKELLSADDYKAQLE